MVAAECMTSLRQGVSDRVAKAIKDVLHHSADYDMEERLSTRGKMMMAQLKST